MTWYSPPGVTWIPVSSRLAVARLICWWSVALPALVAGVVGGRQGGAWWALPAGVLALALWISWILVRQVSAHAWVEREDDLMVRRGRVFRRVTVVPYGRLQFVDVASGPLARAFGIARVQLHTASPGSDAHIAGVPAEEAARLRDRLTTRGEARLAGL
jgi:membrane protein YdbS with pleckstrin-like domain